MQVFGEGKRQDGPEINNINTKENSGGYTTWLFLHIKLLDGALAKKHELLRVYACVWLVDN